MPPDEMRSGNDEVDCRAVTILYEYLRVHGIPVARLHEGAKITFERCQKKGERIGWADYVDLLKRLEALLGSEEALLDRRCRIIGAPGMQAMEKLLAWLLDVRTAYKVSMRWWGPLLFRSIAFQCVDLQDGSLRITIEVKPGYEGSTQYFRTWQMALIAIPETLQLPPAILHLEEFTDRKAVYHILPPASLSLWGRASRAWRVVFAPRSALGEMAKQQEELRAYYDKLVAAREAVFERDARLKLSAQMAALSKFSALGEMSGRMAHEINSPLQAIRTRAEILVRRLEAPSPDLSKLQTEVESIMAEVDKVSRVVISFRTFSRDARGDPLEPVSARRIIEDTMGLCRHRFERLGIELAVFGSDAWVKCRSVQISQVLLNLLNNAVDIVSTLAERWIRIDVAENGDRVEIAVTDPGNGIPANIREKLFQPFFTTKDGDKGTGLGLRVSKDIAESNDGSLWLDEKSPWTRFVLSLPGAAPTS